VVLTQGVTHQLQLGADPQSRSQTRPTVDDSDQRTQQQWQLQLTGCWQQEPRLQDEQVEQQVHPAPDSHTNHCYKNVISEQAGHAL